MSDGQTLNLGTNFNAEVKGFIEGVRQVRSVLKSLRDEVEGVSKKIASLGSSAGVQGIRNLSSSLSRASSQTRTFYGDMTELEKALGRTEKLSGKYSSTLVDLTRGMDRNSLSIKDAEKAMYSTDKVLRGLTRSYNNSLTQIAIGARNWGVVVDRYREFQKAADLGTISQKVLSGELKATEASIKQHIQSVTNGRVVFDKFTESKKRAWPIINQVNKAIDAGSMSWQQAARQQALYQSALQKSTSTTSTLSQKFREVAGSTRNMSTVWRVMNKDVDDGKMSWQQMMRVQAEWQATHTKTGAAIKKTTQDIKDQTKEANLLSRAIESVSRSMKTIASYGTASAMLYGLTHAFKSGKDEIIEYEQALKNIQAITGATVAELQIMDKVMQDVARETKFSGTEIGQAMVLLGQSGFSAAESVNSIRAVAMLATGTLSDMTQTADLLTTTIRSFNMEAIESNRVSDVMANAINKSKLTLEKLRIAFNYVGAASHQSGVKLEETAAALMMLANNGLRASTMGTGLRQMLAKMVAPTAKVREILEGVGMSLNSINPSVVGFQEALMNLRKVMVDSRGMVDMSKAFEMFGLRGAQAAAVIIKSLGPTGGFQDALDNVYEVGTAAHMASIQQEGLAIKIKNMADRAKSLAKAMGDAGLVGAIKIFVDTIRMALTGVLAFTDTAGGALVLRLTIITGLVYGLITALRLLKTALLATGFAAMISEVGFLTAALTKLKALLAVISSSPILLVSAAIAGVGIALNHLMSRLDNAIIKHQKLQAGFEDVSSSLQLYAEAIKQTDGEGREYESLLNRLKEAHPELKKVVDENAFSHIHLAEVMESISRENFLSALIEQAKVLGKLRQKLELEKDAFSDIRFFAQSDDSEKAWENFFDQSKKGKEILKDINGELKSMAVTLYNRFGSDQIQKAMNFAKISFIESGNLKPEEIKQALDTIAGHMEDFEQRRKELSDIEVVKKEDIIGKAREVFEINKSIIAEQHEVERQALDHKLDEIHKAYEQEVREAQWAAVKKKEAVFQGAQDEAKYRHDSFGKYLDVEKNAQGKLLAFRQAGSEQAIRIVRDENGKIVSAHEDRLSTMLNQEEAFQQKSLAIEEASTKRSGLYQKMLNEKLEAVTEFYRQQIKKTETAQSLELEIIKNKYADEVAAAGKISEDKERIEKDYHKRRIELRKEELSILEGLLKDEVDRYEEAQKRIISLREELIGIEKSRTDTLEAIQRKHLSDYQKYKADEAKFAQVMAEARKEAELAALAETDVEQERRFEKSKKLYEEAIKLGESLNRVVEQEKKVIVSASQAEMNAREAVNKAYDGMEAIVKAQIELAENQSESARKNQEKIREEIARTRDELQKLIEKNWVAQVEVKIDGVSNLDSLIKKLKSLDGATTRHTIEVTEKTKTAKRWGGLVDQVKTHVKALAAGGHLSGYGGGDIVDARLEPGEYVVRKEAVRNIGVGVLNAINNLKLGAADIFSSIKAQSGGYLMPQINIQTPQIARMAFQTGGSVQSPGIANLGSLNLSINNQEIGKIYAEPDVLKILSKQVQRKNRLRSNK